MLSKKFIEETLEKYRRHLFQIEEDIVDNPTDANKTKRDIILRNIDFYESHLNFYKWH